MTTKKIIMIAILILTVTLCLPACIDDEDNSDTTGTSRRRPRPSRTTTAIIEEDEKPVIYLYPEEELDVHVKLDYKGDLLVTYPSYHDGWFVTAYPDGTLINKADQEAYAYLFWEGRADITYDFSTGFVVAGQDTELFLKETLKAMGLIPTEYNEFIVYWLPKMINHPYNLISFQQDVYTDHAVLDITPKPDSMLRVFMAFKALDRQLAVPEQSIDPFIRQGFTVIEWGGCQVLD